MPLALGELEAQPTPCVLPTPGWELPALWLKLQGMSAAAGKPRGGSEEEGAAGQEK